MFKHIFALLLLHQFEQCSCNPFYHVLIYWLVWSALPTFSCLVSHTSNTDLFTFPNTATSSRPCAPQRGASRQSGRGLTAIANISTTGYQQTRHASPSKRRHQPASGIQQDDHLALYYNSTTARATPTGASLRRHLAATEVTSKHAPHH